MQEGESSMKVFRNKGKDQKLLGKNQKDHMTQEQIKHWLNGVLGVEQFWYRIEYQARASIHAHGCAKLKNDPDILNCYANVHALHWQCLEKKNPNEMLPEDFKFFCQYIVREGEDQLESMQHKFFVYDPVVYWINSEIVPLMHVFQNVANIAKYSFHLY